MLFKKIKFKGITKSRLPEFTEEEKIEIAGSYDFFGLASYTTRVVTHQEKPVNPPNWQNDRDTFEVSSSKKPACYKYTSTSVILL